MARTRKVPIKRKQQVLKRDKFRCLKCGESDRKKLHVDHVVPASKGGMPTMENLQTLCDACGAKKGDSTDPTWALGPWRN